MTQPWNDTEQNSPSPPGSPAGAAAIITGRYRPSPHSLANRLARAVWGTVWLIAFRPSPKLLFRWRRALLCTFGATIAPDAYVHASVRVWAPWNLTMETHSSLAPGVDCYSVAPVRIGAFASVSQYSYLCTASHDIDSPDMTLISAPIDIADHAWVAADAFVGPGVCIGEGAVVGARASVFRSVAPWTVVGGNPARVLRQRSRAVALARGFSENTNVDLGTDSNT